MVLGWGQLTCFIEANVTRTNLYVKANTVIQLKSTKNLCVQIIYSIFENGISHGFNSIFSRFLEWLVSYDVF